MMWNHVVGSVRLQYTSVSSSGIHHDGTTSSGVVVSGASTASGTEAVPGECSQVPLELRTALGTQLTPCFGQAEDVNLQKDSAVSKPASGKEDGVGGKLYLSSAESGGVAELQKRVVALEKAVWLKEDVRKVQVGGIGTAIRKVISEGSPLSR